MCSAHEVEEKLIRYVPGKLLREATTFLNIKYFSTALKRPLAYQEFEASIISRISDHEGGKIVSFTYRLPLPSGDIHGTYFR
jgi:hypothetical protein